MAAEASVSRTEVLSPNALKARHIGFLIIAAAAPLAFAVGAIPLAIGRGGVGTAAMFIVTGAILLIFAVGYVAMAKHVRRAGGLYTYVSEGLGRVMGTGTAFLVAFAYSVAAVGAIGVFALLMSSLVFELFAVETPWVIWALCAVAVMGILGVLKISINARVLGVIIVCEIAILIIVGVAVIVGGGATGLSLESFSPGEILSGNPGAMLAITISAFAGFEATVLFVEEAKDPERTIPRATYGTVAVLVVLYAFTTWWIIQAYGSEGAVEQATADPLNMFFTAATTYAGESAMLLMVLLVVTSWFATILAFHNAAARYLLALGRDRALPHRLSHVHPRFGSPWVASLTHTTFALVVVLTFALLGADPYLDLYVLGSIPAVLAIPLMEVLAAVAILVYFSRDRRGMSAWRVIVAPAVAAVSLAIILVLVASQLDVFTARGWTINALLIASVVIVLSLGLARALYLKVRKPEVFEGLGTSTPDVW